MKIPHAATKTRHNQINKKILHTHTHTHTKPSKLLVTLKIKIQTSSPSSSDPCTSPTLCCPEAATQTSFLFFKHTNLFPTSRPLPFLVLPPKKALVLFLKIFFQMSAPLRALYWPLCLKKHPFQWNCSLSCHLFASFTTISTVSLFASFTVLLSLSLSRI